MFEFNYHNDYNAEELTRCRLTYERGQSFIHRYLRRHFQEEQGAWEDRLALTYNPSFAAEAVDEYVRAITQRSSDINRVGGLDSYRKLLQGLYGGLDRQGSSMNALMGSQIIPELLSMGRVGIYIENDLQRPYTVADEQKSYPFLLVYKAENIINWRFDSNSTELKSVLLREFEEKIDDLGMNGGYETRYRHVSKETDGTLITVYNEEGEMVQRVLQNTAFPFVLGKIRHSLLAVTSKLQIALMNLSSSDLYYAWSSNFPIYTEQYDQLDFTRFTETRKTDPVQSTDNLTNRPPTYSDGEKRIKVGPMNGRLYPLNAERPGFIHPSSEPLRASMEKEQQLKKDIRSLTALSISQLEPERQASAESKGYDIQGLEAGMTLIAREIERIENNISKTFHSYYKETQYTLAAYPERYNLRTEDERREDADQLRELHQAVPSRTFANEISKAIVNTLFQGTVTEETIAKMYKEIEESPVPTADPEILRSDHEAGLVGDRNASIGRGYAPTEYLEAQKDHSARTARIAAAQSDPGNRGLKDFSADPDAGKKEKQKSQDDYLDKKGRGKEKMS